MQSEESKVEHFDRQSQYSVWRKPDTSHHAKNSFSPVRPGGDSTMTWGCFSLAGARELVRVEEK